MITLRITTTFFLFLTISSLIEAQQILEFKTLGINITVPEGFQHQEEDGFLVMGIHQIRAAVPGKFM